MASPSRHAAAGLDDRDYWRAIFVSFLELFIACVVLVTAAVSLLASKLINFFDLPHPCTYFGLRQRHERSILCEQHRRLALLNLNLHDSCVECLRELTAARIEENARVLPLFSRSVYQELPQNCSVRKLNDGQLENEEELRDGNGEEGVPKTALHERKSVELASLKVGATADRCVKRKFAKVFVEPREDSQEHLPSSEVGHGKADDEKDKTDTVSELSVESVKQAFQAEKDALSSLYVELEEERNASAIAANEAMAMITRLQEEKAAVQMEARQYQRMVEEKAEYDQEAITLLKEILYKREQEKFVLEKEVESYRKRLLPVANDDEDDYWDLSKSLLLLEGGDSFEKKRKELARLQGTNLLQDFDSASSDPTLPSASVGITGNGDESDFLSREVDTGSVRPEDGDFARDKRNEKGSDEAADASSNGNSDIDLRTTSMVMRDNFRLAMEKDIRELTSRLQVLEDDRQLLTQVVQSLTADKPDQLRELVQHFRLKKAEIAVPPVSQVLGCHHECILTS